MLEFCISNNNSIFSSLRGDGEWDTVLQVIPDALHIHDNVAVVSSGISESELSFLDRVRMARRVKIEQNAL